MVVVRERKRQIPAESPIQRKVRSKFYVVLKIGRNIEVAQLGDGGIPAKSSVCDAEQETSKSVAREVANCIIGRICGRQGIKIKRAGARYAFLIILRGATNVDAKVDVVAATCI